jgi:hypothetical protein
MKALSIRQPWAWLIAAGYKDIENRSWSTGLIGRIYIHASQRFDNKALNTTPLNRKGFLDTQALSKIQELALSRRYPAIIGEVDVTDCVTYSPSPWFTGRYGFVLANPVLYDVPIPCKGRTFFFEPDIIEKQF